MKITRREPIRAFLLLDALKDETRRKIIDILLKRKEVTLTEVKNELGKTLPTLMFHFTLLEKTGLISWKIAKKGRKKTRVYYLKGDLVEIELDLNLISKIPKLSTVKELAIRYVDIEMDEGFLEREISLDDIIKRLGVDEKLATAIKNYIEIFEDEITKHILEKIGEDELRRRDPEEISKIYNVDLYWIIKAIKLMR